MALPILILIIQAEVVQTIVFTGQKSTNFPVHFSTNVTLFQDTCREGARNNIRVYRALGISMFELLLKDSHHHPIEQRYALNLRLRK